MLEITRGRLKKLPSTMKKRFWKRALLLNRKVFSVNIDNPQIGLFAHLNVAIRILRYADENRLRPYLKFTSRNYVDPKHGSNWFDYHFELVPLEKLSQEPRFDLRVQTHRDLGLSRSDDLPLSAARALFFKYINIKSEINIAVDRFCVEHGIGPGSIGIHYRGTDKVSEAPRVDYEKAFAILEEEISNQTYERAIFVASDEQSFIELLMQRFPTRSIVQYQDSKRSTGSTPLHLSQMTDGNFLMGRDALINCLILSRCSRIVRTSSLLSSWASIFNPDLSVRLLNKSFEGKAWYPERIIVST